MTYMMTLKQTAFIPLIQENVRLLPIDGYQLKEDLTQSPYGVVTNPQGYDSPEEAIGTLIEFKQFDQIPAAISFFADGVDQVTQLIKDAVFKYLRWDHNMLSAAPIYGFEALIRELCRQSDLFIFYVDFLGHDEARQAIIDNADFVLSGALKHAEPLAFEYLCDLFADQFVEAYCVANQDTFNQVCDNNNYVYDIVVIIERGVATRNDLDLMNQFYQCIEQSLNQLVPKFNFENNRLDLTGWYSLLKTFKSFLTLEVSEKSIKSCLTIFVKDMIDFNKLELFALLCRLFDSCYIESLVVNDPSLFSYAYNAKHVDLHEALFLPPPEHSSRLFENNQQVFPSRHGFQFIRYVRNSIVETGDEALLEKLRDCVMMICRNLSKQELVSYFQAGNGVIFLLQEFGDQQRLVELVNRCILNDEDNIILLSLRKFPDGRFLDFVLYYTGQNTLQKFLIDKSFRHKLKHFYRNCTFDQFKEIVNDDLLLLYDVKRIILFGLIASISVKYPIEDENKKFQYVYNAFLPDEMTVLRQTLCLSRESDGVLGLDPLLNHPRIIQGALVVTLKSLAPEHSSSDFWGSKKDTEFECALKKLQSGSMTLSELHAFVEKCKESDSKKLRDSISSYYGLDYIQENSLRL